MLYVIEQIAMYVVIISIAWIIVSYLRDYAGTILKNQYIKGHKDGYRDGLQYAVDLFDQVVIHGDAPDPVCSVCADKEDCEKGRDCNG